MTVYITDTVVYSEVVNVIVGIYREQIENTQQNPSTWCTSTKEYRFCTFAKASLLRHNKDYKLAYIWRSV